VWLGAPGALRIVAREGNLAPGTTDSAVFADFSSPSANAAGQIAFTASLKAGIGGVTQSNDRGLWATDPAGALQLIAREGEPLEVAPGEFRTITRLEFRGGSGNADGRRSMFNDQGEVLFWAQFVSGEGVFISESVKNAPAPSDFNQDYLVDGADLATWRDGYGITGPAARLDGDADGDLDVDGADFLNWQRQLGGGAVAAPGLASAAPVPEPEIGAMLFTGLASMLRRKKRNRR
jgi:hypothetical protein